MLINLATRTLGFEKTAFIRKLNMLGFDGRAGRFTDEFLDFASSVYDTVALWDMNTNYEQSQ